MNQTQELLDKLGAAVRTMLPESVGEDIRANLRAGIRSVVEDLDVVSREEFEIQSQVLARTREKLERLEVRLRELESRSDLD